MGVVNFMVNAGGEANRTDASAPYLPFDWPPFRMNLDVNKTSEEDWFEIGDDIERSQQMIEKSRLLASQHGDIFMADNRAFHASKMVLNLMLEHLTVFWPDHYSRKDSVFKLNSRPGFKEIKF